MEFPVLYCLAMKYAYFKNNRKEDNAMKLFNAILRLRKQSNNNHLKQDDHNIKFNKSSCYQNGNDGFMHFFLYGDLQ